MTVVRLACAQEAQIGRRLRRAACSAVAAAALSLAALAPAHAATITYTAAAQPAATASAADAALAGRALDWAEGNAAGHTYLYGAAGPGSYDCSGLVMAAYAHLGITLPHNTVAMIDSGKLIAVPVTSAPRGALLFFGTGHVEFKTIWTDMSFGAHSSSDPIIGWRKWWPGSYEPTAAYVVRALAAVPGPGPELRHMPHLPSPGCARLGRSPIRPREPGAAT